MEKLTNKQIELLINMFKNNIELENYVKDTLGFYPCFIYKKENVGEVFNDLHHHDLYEILYIQEGSVLYSIDGIIYQLNEGDLILIPPTILHKLDKVISKQSKRIILTFTDSYAKYLSTKNCDLIKAFEISFLRNINVIHFTKDMKRHLERYFSLMFEVQFSKIYGDDLTFNLRFCQIMLMINKEIMNINEENTNNNHSNKIINETIEYINENLSKKLYLADIANQVSLSSSRLSHLFKEETGLSINKFIIKKRLMLAKLLIRKGEPLGIIFALTGFSDNTSFFRAFKKEYSTTPKKYYINYKKSLY